jgi:hypothetical protein
VFSQLYQNDWNWRCIDPWQVGADAAFGAIGGGIGGKLIPKFLPVKPEFSHWIPKRFIKKLPPSFRKLDGPLNGNLVTPKRHFKHDQFRYPKGSREWGKKLPQTLQQMDRVPDWLKGSIIGYEISPNLNGGN